jgi:hypothetical protein
MTDERYTECTEPDEHGNIFQVESPRELGPRIVREAIAWYKTEPHHGEFGEPERNKKVWISVVEASGGADRSWRCLPNA